MPSAKRQWEASAIGLLVLLAGWATRASAQTVTPGSEAAPAPSAQGRRPARPSAWRVTFRAGGGLVSHPASGTSGLPAPGLPVNLGTGLWTEQVPSWYFGNGASILNTALQTFHVAQHPMVPLDTMLTTADIGRRNGAAFGTTISRQVGSRYRVEFSIDGAQVAPTFTASALSAIEASRASFISSWTGLLTQAGLNGLSVTSTSAIANGGTLEVLATGAVDVILHSTARSTWFATLGAGVEYDPGSAPSTTLVGHSVFNVGSANVPFDQTDTVVIQAVRDRRAIGILGGGWSRDLTRRWGITADVRVALGGTGVSTVLNASPAQVLQPERNRQLILIFPGAPAVIFNNSGFQSFPSTLSSLPLSSFTTFRGTGLQMRTELTGGVYLRF